MPQSSRRGCSVEENITRLKSGGHRPAVIRGHLHNVPAFRQLTEPNTSLAGISSREAQSNSLLPCAPDDPTACFPSATHQYNHDKTPLDAMRQHMRSINFELPVINKTVDKILDRRGESMAIKLLFRKTRAGGRAL
jgi:hypothetical protein